MSNFRAAFTTWREQHPQISLNRLGDSAGLVSSEMSRIAKGPKRPTFDSMCKLIPAIAQLSTPTEARALLVAHLRDELPPEYKNQIRILPVDEAGTVDLNDPLSRAFARLEGHARSDPEYARWILLGDGYMHDEDAAAVEEMANQFEAEQAAALGIKESSALRTPAQILASYDLHALSERSGITVAELSRIQSGRQPVDDHTVMLLSRGFSIPDTQDLHQWYNAQPQQPSRIHQLPSSHWQETTGERAAEQSESYKGSERGA
jgi:transcriptional regulator with XRE-family HTH domain